MSNPYDQLVPGEHDSETPEPKPTEPQPQEKPMDGDKKPIVQSKTFWVNIITAVAGVVTSLVGSDLIQQHPEWAAYGATALAVMNIVLRLVTDKPVSITGK